MVVEVFLEFWVFLLPAENLLVKEIALDVAFINEVVRDVDVPATLKYLILAGNVADDLYLLDVEVELVYSLYKLSYAPLISHTKGTLYPFLYVYLVIQVI